MDIKKPILTIKEAIQAKSFHEPHPTNHLNTLVRGDAHAAINSAKNKISGEIELDGSQFNFYIEGIISIVEHIEDGYKLQCTTQWLDSVQRSVADVLGTQKSSSIDLEVKQLGGGFGGKTTRPNFAACAAAVAAHHLRRPVKVFIDLNDCMTMFGKRPAWLVKYNVGFDDDGKLSGLDYEWFSDPGCSTNGSLLFICPAFFDTAYQCSNYLVKPYLVKTNKPASTEVRSPDIFPSVCITEQIMEHVSMHLGKDPLEIRQLNLYKKGDVTPFGHELPYIELDLVINKARCN